MANDSPAKSLVDIDLASLRVSSLLKKGGPFYFFFKRSDCGISLH